MTGKYPPTGGWERVVPPKPEEMVRRPVPKRAHPKEAPKTPPSK